MEHTIRNVNIRNVSKQTYLKTFLLHVFIYNIFLLFNLIMAMWIIQQSITGDVKIMHSIIYFLLPWMPGLFMIPVQIKKYIDGGLKQIIFGITVFTLFPILPTIFFIAVLCGQIQNLRLHKSLDHLNNIKVILHTSYFIMCTIFLLIRGDLSLEYKSCFEDKLGRSACSGFLVIITFLIAMLLLLTAVYEICGDSSELVKNVISTIFRTVVTSLIINYLDYWSAIPITIIFTIEYLFIFNNKSKILNQDETDSSAKLWNGTEWIYLQQQENNCESNRKLKGNNDKDEISTLTITVIQILIPNLFTKNSLSVIVLNCINLFVLLVISYLVNLNQNFNYESNILNNQTYNILSLLIFIYGIISLCLELNISISYLLDRQLTH